MLPMPRYVDDENLKYDSKTYQRQGMYVMCDVVANHMGADDVTTHQPAPMNLTTSYHPACDIDYNNQTSIEWCRIANVLPDVYTQHPDVRTAYQTWIKWLVNEFQFDGLRIDTVKHVEKDFWPPFVSAAGVYAVGEVLNGDPAYVNNYTKVMPGLLNYPMYYPVKRFFLNQGTSQDLVNMMDTIKNTFPDPTTLGNFIDNHDNERFLNDTSDTALLKNALAWVILSRGIPILYYGTEQAYHGGADPNNREDLWRSNFNTNTDMYTSIQKIAGARKAAGGLPANDHTHLYVNSTAYAWSRLNGSLVVLTTNGGSNYNAQHCFYSQVNNGQWKDVFSGSGTVIKADSTGRVCVNVVKGLPIILQATTQAPALPVSSASVAPSSSVKASSVAASSAAASSAKATSVAASSAKASSAAPTVSAANNGYGSYGYGYNGRSNPKDIPASYTTLRRAGWQGY